MSDTAQSLMRIWGLRPIASVALLFAAFSVQASTIVYFVDQDATGAGDGSSWADAYTDLQPALNAAQEYIDLHQGPVAPDIEVWVAEGIYRPTKEYVPPNQHSLLFALVDTVKLYGGFVGNEISLSERIVPTFLNRTILSCDLDGDDFDGDESYLGDAALLVDHPDRDDNCHHVIAADDVSSDTVLDGFTISSGHANDIDSFSMGSNFAVISGGGLIASTEAELVIRNNWFTYNFAYSEGGAISSRGAVKISDSRFIFNHAATGNGGAIMIGSHDIPNTPGAVIENSYFADNYGVSEGGAINISDVEQVLIKGSTFVRNFNVRTGGAVSITNNGEAEILSSVFYKNEALIRGGAIYVANSSELVLTNSTIVENLAGQWPGLTTKICHGLCLSYN